MFETLSINPAGPATALAARGSGRVLERDEFGPITGPLGLFSAAASEPLGLLEREDLGHGLCAWLPREDLL